MGIEDKEEIETLMDIVINQIPSYVNMVNSENWDVNLADCILGMVYHSFVAKSTDYLNNKLTDAGEESTAESTFEMMNLVSDVFNDKLSIIKQAIVSSLNT